MKTWLPRTLTTALCVLPLLAAPVFAQDGDEPEAPAEEAPAEETPAEETPAAPVPAKDVLKLKNGEVITGTIVQLTGEELTFASDTLGEVKLPWAEVESIEAGNAHEYETAEGKVSGTATGGPGDLRLLLGSGEEVMVGEGQLKAINPDPEKTEIDYWSAKIVLGYSQTFGNTRQRTGTALASIARDDGTLRWVLEGISVYGQSDGEEIAKAHRAFTQFDYNVTDRLYVTPFVGSLDYDRFANIDRRFRGGPGAGFWILKDAESVTWNAEAGYAYTHTVFRRVNPGTKRTRSSHAARAATRVTIKLGEHVALRGFYESYIGTGDIQDTTHHVEATASFKYSFFSFDIGLIYDRQERTTRRASDGKLPKRNDAKIIAGVGVAF
jgi:hypothetical protein